jgi:hypothetical protein
MGKTVQPGPVKIFTGVLTADSQILPAVREAMERRLGPVDFISDAFDFNQTDYYESEMGKHIRRWFWSFENLFDPGRLPEIKLFTNHLEDSFCRRESKRTVNLDPGYLDFYKLVLASVKERAQKIYLSKGIYADPTLYYLKGKWHAFDWSLPDFKQNIYYGVFQNIRDRYRQKMRLIKPGEIVFDGF